jgi:hypothetical protein
VQGQHDGWLIASTSVLIPTVLPTVYGRMELETLGDAYDEFKKSL